LPIWRCSRGSKDATWKGYFLGLKDIISNFKKEVDLVLKSFLDRIVEFGPMQKPSPPKPVGHKKGLRLQAFKLKPKSKTKDKPFSERASCLDPERGS
jgi:hypothetical protein